VREQLTAERWLSFHTGELETLKSALMMRAQIEEKIGAKRDEYSEITDQLLVEIQKHLDYRAGLLTGKGLLSE
jgi:hypothetical protein